MTLPHPSAIRRQCAEARALLDEHDRDGITKLYRTAHNMAYDKVKTEEVNVKSTGHSNPTLSGVVDRQASDRRKLLEAAGQKLTRAFGEIHSAHALLEMAIPDQRSLPSAAEPDSAVGPGYVKAQREQQRKRVATAEWNPDSAEVV